MPRRSTAAQDPPPLPRVDLMPRHGNIVIFGAVCGVLIAIGIAKESYLSLFLLRWFFSLGLLLIFVVHVYSLILYYRSQQDILMYSPLHVGLFIGIFCTVILSYEFELLSYKLQAPVRYPSPRQIATFCKSVISTGNL